MTCSRNHDNGTVSQQLLQVFGLRQRCDGVRLSPNQLHRERQSGEADRLSLAA